MNNDAKYRRLLNDLGLLIKEYALEAKRRSEDKEGEARAFYRGIVFGYVNVISLMQAQAGAFDIGLDEIRLADIDPEKHLI